MTAADDWRLTGREFLQGVTLRWKSYYRWSEAWDHDHCEFCGAEFDTNPDCDALREGYAVLSHTVSGQQFPDDYRWICRNCFEDFKDTFAWTVVPV